MTKDERKLVNTAIKWILDERVSLPISSKTKITNMNELRREMIGWQFEVIISGTLELTEKALHDAIENMSEAHRLAAKIKVPEPSDDEIKIIKADLQAVSKRINADTTATNYLKTVGTLLSSIEPLIK